jgi:aldose 1-epimerase
MHGLILKAKTDDVQVKKIPGGEEVTGVIHAGDFGGYWLSKTDLMVTVAHRRRCRRNHRCQERGRRRRAHRHRLAPYFNLPSGDRTQARVHIPANTTAEVDGYDNVFPTGKILPVDGTRYDLRAPDGKALGTSSLTTTGTTSTG